MASIETGCTRCGAEEYELLDSRTGEVRCKFCRNRWIIPSLIQKTETEKFLEEQAKRPQVTMDNTTETDKQLMDMVSKAAGAAASGGISRILRIVALVAIAVIVLFVLSCAGIISLVR